MRISRKGNRAAWALLSACFLLALFCSTGSAASITPDSLHQQWVIFGEINYTGKNAYYSRNGSAYQTGTDSHTGPILWKAAKTTIGGNDETDQTITLLSEYVLGGTQAYNAGSDAQFGWAGTSVQTWLNGMTTASDFLYSFNDKEKTDALFAPNITAVGAPGNQGYSPGMTTDKVFLFNDTVNGLGGELDAFLVSFYGGTITSPRRISNYKLLQKPSVYWLRSCGFNTYNTAYVHDGGNVTDSGSPVDNFGYIAVRPALKLNLSSVIFKSLINNSDFLSLLGFFFAPIDAAGGGQISEAYMLFCQAASDIPANEVGLSVNGSKLTVSFDQRAAYAYNHIDPPDANNLKDKFEVTNGGANMVTAADVVDGKIVLTLNKTFASGESVSSLTVQYVDYAPADTYGIGLLGTREYVNKINSGNAIAGTVTNATPNPNPGGGDDGGSTPVTPSPSAKSTDVRSVSVTIDGTAYEGTVEGDQITLNVPAGTDISNLNIVITGYPGATVTPKPPYDFSNGPITITVKSPDGSKTQTYTITVNVAAPQPVPTNILNALASGCTAKLTQNADGTWGVEILIPFASGFTPEEIETIAAALSGLSGVKFYYVDETGAATEISTRKAGVKYLRITGTAADKAALSNVALTSVSVWKKNDATEYKQGMNLKLSDIPGGKPAEEPASGGSGGSSGCDAGAFGLLTLSTLAYCLFRRR